MVPPSCLHGLGINILMGPIWGQLFPPAAAEPPNEEEVFAPSEDSLARHRALDIEEGSHRGSLLPNSEAGSNPRGVMWSDVLLISHYFRTR